MQVEYNTIITEKILEGNTSNNLDCPGARAFSIATQYDDVCWGTTFGYRKDENGMYCSFIGGEEVNMMKLTEKDIGKKVTFIKP